MKEKRVFCSMIDIEREYYPDTFLERKNKLKKDAIGESEVSLAQIAIEGVKKELEELASVR